MLSVRLQCMHRSEAADHLLWDWKLLTYICWHFQIPAPRCEPSKLVPTQWWFSPDLLTVTYKVNFISCGLLFFFLPRGKEFISVHYSELLFLQLPGFHCSAVLLYQGYCLLRIVTVSWQDLSSCLWSKRTHRISFLWRGGWLSFLDVLLMFAVQSWKKRESYDFNLVYFN